jgi:TetR/AcrR family transcriptional repressor of nem operon
MKRSEGKKDSARTDARRNGREKLLEVGTALFRERGYEGSSVDDICAAAGLTKGAFFHHFSSKEELAGACLARWGARGGELLSAGAFMELKDPADRLLGCMDFILEAAQQGKLGKSCLAGTLVQEISETHPALREGAQVCFATGEKAFSALVEAAFKSRKKKADAGSLARLWFAALQGSLVLAKAGRDERVILESLRHVREYIAGLLNK